MRADAAGADRAIAIEPAEGPMVSGGDGPFGLPVGLVAIALAVAGAVILVLTPFQLPTIATQLGIGLFTGGVLVVLGILLLTDDLAEAKTHFVGDDS